MKIKISKKIIITLVLSFVVIMLGKMLFYSIGARKLYYSLKVRDSVDQLVSKYNQKKLPEFEKSNSYSYNIILILTDDQNYRTLAHMPYLYALSSAKGLVFKNAFATCPTCCPFRASLISGGFDSHETGVKALNYPNGTLYRLDENRTIATYLQSKGIKTGFIGKYMHGYKPGYVPPGWDSFVANEHGGHLSDYWNLFNITYGKSTASAAKGDVRYSLFPKKKYITTFQTDEALAFIDTYKDNQFFLFLSYYAPHAPFIAETPEDIDFSSSIPYSCNQDADLELKPEWVKTLAGIVSANKEEFGECGEKSFYGQVALLQSVDRGIQRIVDRLSIHNLTGKTVILFASDNGIILGSKILHADKGMPYEDSIRVPLVAFIPNTLPQEYDQLVPANLDLGATILDLAGTPNNSEGVSLLDIINKDYSLNRNRLLIENYGYLDYLRRRRGYPLPPIIWSGFRTTKWKYVEYTTGEIELYDLDSDPDELKNLAGDNAFEKVINKFHEDLEQEKGLAITTTSIPDAYVNIPYEYQIKAWGGVKPYKWDEPSSLPEGMHFNKTTGLLYGNPQKAGRYEVRFSLIDSGTMKHSLKPDHFSWNFSFKVCAPDTDC